MNYIKHLLLVLIYIYNEYNRIIIFIYYLNNMFN